MRLINSEKLLRDITETYEYEFPTACGEFDEFVTRILPNVVKNQPTVDAVPVVHEHWAWFEKICPSTTEHYEEIEDCGWKCVCCDKTLEEMVGGYWDDFYSVPNLNYCPNCGAKMDKTD